MDCEKMLHRLAFGMVLSLKDSMAASVLSDAGKIAPEVALEALKSNVDSTIQFATAVLCESLEGWDERTAEFHAKVDRAMTHAERTTEQGDLHAVVAEVTGTMLKELCEWAAGHDQIASPANVN